MRQERTGSGPGSGADGPVAAVRALVDDAGIGARRVRRVVGLLARAPQTLATLVESSGVDRRTVEAVLAALGSDLVDSGAGRVGIAPGRVGAYHDLVAPEPYQPYGQLLDGHEDLVERMRDLIARAPAARRGLDHVAATARTVALRALWLDATFDLSGARVLCVGDHDLTSLALHAVNPAVAVTVVDIDDGVLEHIDVHSGSAVRCVWADLRFGLPASMREWCDLVVTDPPYTPEGVRLFLGRGLQALRERAMPSIGGQARLVMAYGFGEQPALGVRVQQAVTDLHLAYEAILPGFNRYHGAQAVGSTSDLYVLRPTARSFRIAEPARPRGGGELAIYTHGGQSLEGTAHAPLGDLGTAVVAAAAGPAALPVGLVGPGWPSTEDPVPLRDLLGGGEPPAVLRRLREGGVAADLRADPGGWLPRVLLAVTAARLAVLVPNNHPDLVDERAQRALAELVGAKYRLRLRRSTPGPRLAVVEAERATPSGPALPARAVLERAHGKVANIWREALTVARPGPGLSRNEAREHVGGQAVLPAAALDDRLLHLPRRQIAALVAALSATPGDER